MLPVVRKVEEEITSGKNLSHEYLGQLGLEELSKAATRLLLGNDSIALKENRVCKRLFSTLINACISYFK